MLGECRCRVLNGGLTGSGRHMANKCDSFLLKDGSHEILVANITTVNLQTLISVFFFAASNSTLIIHCIGRLRRRSRHRRHGEGSQQLT
jgi:hypothetical protein